MSGINPTFTNILDLIGSLYPLFIVSFLFIASLFNVTFLKGLTYLGGITVCFVFWILIGNLFNKPRDKSASLTCNLLSIPGNFKLPSLPIIVSIFTLTYLVVPMIESSNINPVIIGVMTILSGINMYYQYYNSCTTILGIVISIILGVILGLLWFTIIFTGKKDLLFYNELLSNNVVCNRPKKQKFKCSVYKNGEIISSNVV